TPCQVLELGDDDRQLGRTDDLRDIEDLPPAELGSITEIEILREGVMRPATGVLDGGPPPDAGRPVEVEQEMAAAPRRLFDAEVTIDAQRLRPCQQGEVLVEMPPASLDDPDVRLREIGDGSPKKIRGRNEVRVEDRHELPARLLEPSRQRSGLEARALDPVDVDYVNAARLQPLHHLGEDALRVVRRLVENLDLKPVCRIVEVGRGLQQPPGHVPLVVEG